MRLDRYISAITGLSRRDVKAALARGRVRVDGASVRDAAQQLDEHSARVELDGRLLEYRRHMHVMLNKPAGYLSATEDGRGPTVLDLLPPELQRRGLFPVGRLDKDTEGLLLLTNEGRLAHDLLSPRRHVDKVYRARVTGCLTAEDAAAFAAGLVLGDGTVCRPAGLEILSAGAESVALVTLREGKFHQVKRMLAQRGKPVTYLERLRMGNLTLDPALERGDFRFLTEQELEALRNLERLR